MRFAQVLVLAILAGCVRAGFEGDTSRDGAAHEAPVDSPSPADRRADRALPDGGDPQRTPPLVAACQATCVGETDCDGLPDYRDPEPSACNELLFEETFATAPQGWRTAGGSWSWQPGWYTQSAIADLAWTKADAAFNNADYLVEARIKLGSPSTAQSWVIAVVSRFVNPDRYLYGGITVEPAYNPPIPKPDLIIRARRDARPYVYKDPDSSGYSEGYPSDLVAGYTPPTFDTGAGREYYLQLYYTQNPHEMVTCLLYDETSKQRQAIYALYAYPAYKPHLPTEPGTVGFHTRNRGAAIDFIRVFRLHKTTAGGA